MSTAPTPYRLFLLAAKAGDIAAITQMLSTSPANQRKFVTTVCPEGTALHLATQGGHLSLMQLLLYHQAPINQVDKNGRTALHLASFVNEDVDVVMRSVHLLLQYGALTDIQDKDKWTALHFAAHYGHAAVVEMLLDHGAQTFHKDVFFKTALHDAAADGRVAVVRVLVEHGALCDEQDKEGWTPLHYAASKGHSSVVYVLVAHGADRALLNSDKRSALDEANEVDEDEVRRRVVSQLTDATWTLM